MNSLLKSGYPRTGAVTEASFSASNACWCSGIHLNYLVLVVSLDAASFLLFLPLAFLCLLDVGPTNSCRHWAILQTLE